MPINVKSSEARELAGDVPWDIAEDLYDDQGLPQ